MSSINDGGASFGEVGDDHIRVVVRVRPFNSREKEKGSKCVVEMDGATTVIRNPADGQTKQFIFDYSYWSFDRQDRHYSSQDKVFADLGGFAMRSAVGGYNVSIFAYGQTGAGKTHSIIGHEGDPGIVPRLMRSLFDHIAQVQRAKEKPPEFKVEAAMLEIYNDHIRDLFNPRNSAGWNLRVREHPKTGPFVEGLSWLVAQDFSEIEQLLDTGYRARTVASTVMNNESSRSHAVFQVLFTQSDFDPKTGKSTSKLSKISLVDLAGSERYGSESLNSVEQARMAEGRHINKSLSTLASCIYALYRAAKNPNNKQIHVPYRDSSLTWLLRESLGGNARTVMLAAISPADLCYDESLSTLRYANQAKRIKTHAVINEDINEKIIRELRAEINQLREELRSYQNASDNPRLVISVQEMTDRLNDNERMMTEMSLTWDEKVQRSERIREEQRLPVASPKEYPAEPARTPGMNLGISLSGLGASLNADHKCPQLVNLNEDPLPTEFLVYFLSEGVRTVGSDIRPESEHIELAGPDIKPHHATLRILSRQVSVEPMPDCAVFVNGKRIEIKTALQQGNRLAFGRSHIFRFNDPEEAARLRRQRDQSAAGTIPEQNIAPTPTVDWEYARRELQSSQLESSAADSKPRGRRRAAPPSSSTVPSSSASNASTVSLPSSDSSSIPSSPPASSAKKSGGGGGGGGGANISPLTLEQEDDRWQHPLPPLSDSVGGGRRSPPPPLAPPPPVELGIGVLLQRQGALTTILDLVAGGPAHGSGELHVGQIVLEVDGQKVESLQFQEVLALIRGPVGSYVILKVANPDPEDSNGFSNVRVVKIARTLPQQQTEGEVQLHPAFRAVAEGLTPIPPLTDEDLGSEASDDEAVALESLSLGGAALHEGLGGGGEEEEEDLGEELGEELDEDDEAALMDLSVAAGQTPSAGRDDNEEDLGEEMEEEDDMLESLEVVARNSSANSLAMTPAKSHSQNPATSSPGGDGSGSSPAAAKTPITSTECRSYLGLEGSGALEEDVRAKELCIRIRIDDDHSYTFPIFTMVDVISASIKATDVVLGGKTMQNCMPGDQILQTLKWHSQRVVGQEMPPALLGNIAFQLLRRLEMISALLRVHGATGEAGSMYRFNVEDRRAIRFASVFQNGVHSALCVSEYLIRRLLACFAIVPAGDVRGSPSFESFVHATAELQLVNVSALSVRAVLAFFLNVYNCLCLHAHATRGLPDGCDFKPSKSAFVKDAQYRIGGRNYSLEDIMNRVLRSKTVRKSAVPEPRIHFALVDGTRSSPAISVYSQNNLDEELNTAARHYLQREVQVTASTKALILPRIFKWYSQDFGKDKYEIARFIFPFLAAEDQKELSTMLMGGGFKIKYKDYDWRIVLRPPRLPTDRRMTNA